MYSRFSVPIFFLHRKKQSLKTSKCSFKTFKICSGTQKFSDISASENNEKVQGLIHVRQLGRERSGNQFEQKKAIKSVPLDLRKITKRFF